MMAEGHAWFVSLEHSEDVQGLNIFTVFKA